MVEFICWVAVVSLSAAFFLGLASKWGWIEWAQVHAPSDFLHELLSCKFCCSFHASMIISLTLCVVTGHLYLLLVPICSTVITRELW